MSSYKVRPNCSKAPDGWHEHPVNVKGTPRTIEPCTHCGEVDPDAGDAVQQDIVEQLPLEEKPA